MQEKNNSSFLAEGLKTAFIFRQVLIQENRIRISELQAQIRAIENDNANLKKSMESIYHKINELEGNANFEWQTENLEKQSDKFKNIIKNYSKGE
jgi:septal ring factor EnvC (AmiA/AmiB activator)